MQLRRMLNMWNQEGPDTMSWAVVFGSHTLTMLFNLDVDKSGPQLVGKN